MHRQHHLVRASLSIGPILIATALVAGCLSSDDPAQPDAGSGLDAGTTAHDGSLANGDDGSPSGDDATTPLDGTASTDGNPSADGSTLTPLASCDTPIEIDSANVVASDVSAVTLGGGKYAVFWGENPASGSPSRKARVFDGTTFAAEQTVLATSAPVTRDSADGLGNAYELWTSGRAVLDHTTGMFGAVDGTFAVIPLSPFSMAITGLRVGGAFTLYTTSGNIWTTRYDPSGGTWSTADLRESGGFNTPNIATNGSGKVVAAWLGSIANGVSALSIATFDGTTWSAVTHSTIGSGTIGQGPDTFGLVEYANGDALIAYVDVNAGAHVLKAQRYRTATATWDAVQTVDANAAVNLPQLFMDDSDRATIVYLYSTGQNEAYATRDLGSGWSAPVDLGPRPGVNAALDPSGNVVVVVDVSASGLPAVRRCAAGGTTWDPPVSLGFATAVADTSGVPMIAFDGAGHPVIVAFDTIDAGRAARVAVCR